MALFFFCKYNDTTVLHKDLLLYDFDVAVGDTILYDYLDSIKIEITLIDNILIQNQYRKRYYYNYASTNSTNCNGLFWGYNYYIESIGSTLGIFGHLGMYFENDAQLLCFEDTAIAYPSATYCANAVGIEDRTINKQISLYPNPNNGNFTLKIETPFNQAALTIFDATGKQLLQQNITQTATQLSLFAYPKGMYFYHVKVNNELITGKMIVN